MYISNAKQWQLMMGTTAENKHRQVNMISVSLFPQLETLTTRFET